MVKALTQEGLNPGQQLFARWRREILFPADFGCFGLETISEYSPNGRNECLRIYLKICGKNKVFSVELDVLGSTV